MLCRLPPPLIPLQGVKSEGPARPALSLRVTPDAPGDSPTRPGAFRHRSSVGKALLPASGFPPGILDDPRLVLRPTARAGGLLLATELLGWPRLRHPPSRPPALRLERPRGRRDRPSQPPQGRSPLRCPRPAGTARLAAGVDRRHPARRAGAGVLVRRRADGDLARSGGRRQRALQRSGPRTQSEAGARSR